MYESIEEVLEDLGKMLEFVDETNSDDVYHIALELGHQFKEELEANSDY